MEQTTGNRKVEVLEQFMASTGGRVARVALGSGVIVAGLFLVPAPFGIGLAVAGLAPIASGVFNVCPVAPAWGGKFLGSHACPSKVRVSHDE